MPPDSRLTTTQINDLVEWVKLGAPDPRTNAPALAAAAPAKPAYAISVEEGRKHWAYQPVKVQPLPKTKPGRVTRWTTSPSPAWRKPVSRPRPTPTRAR